MLENVKTSAEALRKLLDMGFTHREIIDACNAKIRQDKLEAERALLDITPLKKLWESTFTDDVVKMYKPRQRSEFVTWIRIQLMGEPKRRGVGGGGRKGLGSVKGATHHVMSLEEWNPQRKSLEVGGGSEDEVVEIEVVEDNPVLDSGTGDRVASIIEESPTVVDVSMMKKDALVKDVVIRLRRECKLGVEDIQITCRARDSSESPRG